MILETFPKLTHEIQLKIGYIPADYEFYYTFHGERMNLTAEKSDSSTSKSTEIKLTDPVGKWHPETQELKIDINFLITTPMFLFGENGLVPKDGGRIGIAVIWTDPDGNERGVFKLGELNSNAPGPLTINQTVRFPKQLLRGMLSMKTVLYLKEKGNPVGREIFQAKEPGTILGELDMTRVIIDGNGALFPIHEVSSINEPLWWVSCTWTDATEDTFTEDNFCLYLNTANKEYSELNSNNGIRESALLQEIICHAIETLITKAMQDDEVLNGVRAKQHFIPGTIADMVEYLLYKFDLQYDSDNPEIFAKDVRRALMRKGD